jgi:hypothetical protein
MPQPTLAVDPPPGAEGSSTPDLHLHGCRLPLARSIWLVLAAGLFANFIASIPAYQASVEQWNDDQ